MKYLPFFLTVFSLTTHAQIHVEGVVRGSLIANNADTTFIEKGTGTFRTNDIKLSLSQAVLDFNLDLSNSIDAHVVVNGYDDGDKNLGVTQAYLEYKPLSSAPYRLQSRLGFFYPKLSVENTDTGWLAKNFITSSFINSWIGEELRIPGIELSLNKSGRRANSPWSWQFDIAAYKGNDTLGALIAWKGFGLHDRQTLHHEQVEFAPIPAVRDIIISPTWTVPFTEIDGRLGYYLGFKTQYLRKLDIRYFYYNNQADPLIFDERRLYSWYTVFNSLSTRYLISPNTELSFHFLDGLTEMGDQVVFVDYTAFYAAISHTANNSKFSLRVDYFNVRERDLEPRDPNTSKGAAITLNWTYQLLPNWQSAIEVIYNKNTVANRATVGIVPSQIEKQIQMAITYRF